MRLARTIELQSATPSYPKAPRGVTPGAQSGPKHQQLARQVGGVSLIQASSMAITFQHKIALRLGSVFCFRTISSVADEEGILYRIADPPEKKPSLKISGKAGTEQEIAQPLALQAKTASCKPGAENSFTRRTPLSTSSMEKWTRITRKKKKQTRLRPVKLPFWYLLPQRRTERSLSSRQLHSTPTSSSSGGEWNRPPFPTTNQPCLGKNLLNEKLTDEGTDAVMPDDIMKLENETRRSLYHEMRSRRRGETPDEQVFRERRNSRRRDRRQAQEQAEQEARQRRENPLFGRNLNPDFARAMNTPSEVGGVLARIADGLPRTPDAEGYRRLLTRAANHLLPLAHPPSDLCHAINSRRDARSSINALHERRHENEIQRRGEYDRDHGIPARSQATRVESATASTGGTTRGRSRQHIGNSPPQDRHHNRQQEDTCGVSTLTPRLRAIQWPPNFKVSNVDKYEPKQDP